jgi:hypothetical protein
MAGNLAGKWVLVKNKDIWAGKHNLCLANLMFNLRPEDACYVFYDVERDGSPSNLKVELPFDPDKDDLDPRWLMGDKTGTTLHNWIKVCM